MIFLLLTMRTDFARLRHIPILSVAHVLGMQLRRTGGGTWNMVDPENPKHLTSLVLFEKTNSWYRFSGKECGGVSGGSTLDLVLHIRECSLHEAVNFLTSHFPL
jgi:hypothetical protein